MNLTWHIIKKDLHCIVWTLVFWLVSGIYVATHPVWSIRNISESTFTYLPLVATLVHAVMIVAAIVAVIQADDTTSPTSFWRSRPISPARLAGSKLLLLGILFVGIQLWLQPGVWRQFPFPRVYPSFEALGWAVLTLSLAVLVISALAACVKDLGQFCLLGGGCILACALMSMATEAILPKNLNLGGNYARAFQSATITIGLVCGAVASAVLYNQYFRHRRWVSLVLIAVGCLAAVLVNRLSFLIFT